MASASAHAPGVEPLARLIRAARDAAGLNDADLARITGLSTQHVSQIVNRQKNYTRPPTVDTLQALQKIPGLSQPDILRAVQESTGLGVSSAAAQVKWTGARRSAHNLIDRFPESRLPGVVQILSALLDEIGES